MRSRIDRGGPALRGARPRRTLWIPPVFWIEKQLDATVDEETETDTVARPASVMGRLGSSSTFNGRPSRLGFRSRASASATGRMSLCVVHGFPEAIPAPVRGCSIGTSSGPENERSGYVRRRVLSSVRGRRDGRQRHARSKAIPSADLFSVLDRNRAVGEQARLRASSGAASRRGDTGDRHLQARSFPPLPLAGQWDAAPAMPSGAPSPPRG